MKTQKRGSRGLRIFVSLFVALGVAGVVAAIIQGLSGFETTRWPTVQGKILESKVDIYQTKGRRNRIHELMYTGKVIYEYAVNGQPHRGDNIRFGSVDTSDIADARQIAERYPKGKDVTVHYDPDRPERAVLEVGPGPGVLIPLGGGLFFIVFPLGFYYAWNKLEQQVIEESSNNIE